MTLQDRLFPATIMPDQDWWHALWPDPDGVALGAEQLAETHGLLVAGRSAPLAASEGAIFLRSYAPRIHAPVGLDLGGRAAAEIAVSVLAQVIQERYRRAP